MDNFTTAIMAAIVLMAAVHIGRNISSVFPRVHLDSETKDAVKRGLALIATLTALVLGLLVSTGKASFDPGFCADVWRWFRA